MKVENVCIVCSKPFFTEDVDSYICSNCIELFVEDYYKQIEQITKVERRTP
jgi:hypothetical protein